jgi:penicillin-binding protein 1A
MGITTPLQGLPAEGIGGLKYGVSPLELSDAYATLASGGIRHRPVAIAKVVLPGGKVEHPQGPQPKRVLSPAVAWQVTRLLRDNITEGTGTAAYTGCVGQAGKTGTTDEYTDAWFSGYQPNLATAVWVGYPESNAISMTDVNGITVFGGTYPAEIWHSLYADAGVPCDQFHAPEEEIEWAPGYGAFTAAAPGTGGAKVKKGKGGGAGGTGAGEEDLPGQGAVGGYNPNAYAPGAGQEPAPLPPPLPPADGGPEPGVGGEVGAAGGGDSGAAGGGAAGGRAAGGR